MDHEILDVNNQACLLLEQPRTALLKRSIFAFIGQGKLPGLANAAAAASAGSVECNLSVASGKVFPCRIASSGLANKHGKPVGTLILLRDLSGQAQQAAYLSRMATIIQHTTEGVMMMDKNGHLDMVNPAYSTITGFNPEDVLDKAPQFLRYGQIWAELISAGHWQGEIINRRKNGEAYPEWLTLDAVPGMEGEAQRYIGLFTDVSHMKKSEDELKHMAHYDALTDLANRTLMSIQLDMALERAARRTNKLAVFALDLDGFKAVNDSLGHHAGDLLLQKIAARLKATLRGEDVVARMGGDEFAMIIENPPSAIHIGHLAEKIIAAVGKPMDLHGNRAHVTASLGIAIFPQDGQDASILLKAADTAMYASKQAGRNTYRYHDDEMTKAANQRMTLEQGLRQALENNQLELCFQPQVNIRTGQVPGVEALVRWNHPDQGPIYPAEFLSVAEETGLILPLGEWALRLACTQVQSWVQEQLFTGSVSINVSGQQLEQGDFFSMVKRVLAETGINPKRLAFEISEGILLRNTKRVMAELGQLHTLGVSIVIDDFGVGYSSLTYLKYLSAQGIKINQRFVLGLPGDKNDAAITRAIIAMGHSLGCDLIAEGVETEAQQTFLADQGCLLAQGLLYSKPITADEFRNWLRERQLRTVPDAPCTDILPFGRRLADSDGDEAGEGRQGDAPGHPRWWQ
ncbi:MAG: EAL domain-containing protein [Gallionellaceae bacterium]|nr:EAL domain-containing protein [Gallionellaceae bacterium]